VGVSGQQPVSEWAQARVRALLAQLQKQAAEALRRGGR
jgi:hypothetical protein